MPVSKLEQRDDVYVKPEPEPERAFEQEEEDDDDDDLDKDGEDMMAELEHVDFFEDGDLKVKQIKPAEVTNRNLNDLFGLMNSPYLVLDPEYQRDVVWDETRSSALISSLFQGYFIPPVIFNIVPKHDEVDPTKTRYLRICVDGKQRLTSIFKFMSGKIGFLDSNVPPKKWYYCNPKDKDGSEKETNHLVLSDASKMIFRKKHLVCYEFSNLHPSIEENMFQLVQRGMPLTPAEKLRAMSTNWATFGKKYEADYPRVINLCAQKRASGFRAIIGIFAQLMEVMSPTAGSGRAKNREGISHNPTLQTGANTLTRLVAKQDASLNEAAKAHFKKVFDKFQDLIDMDTTELPGKVPDYKINPDSAFARAPNFLREQPVGHVKTFSQLELLATAVLISVHGRDRSNAMLLGDIKEMRHYLREHHKDLRLNNSCWTTAWKFIDDELVRRRGGKGTRPVAGAALVPDVHLPVRNGESSVTHQPSPYWAAPVASMAARAVNGNATPSDARRGPVRTSARQRSYAMEQPEGGEDAAIDTPRRKRHADLDLGYYTFAISDPKRNRPA